MLTIQYLRYSEIDGVESRMRIRKILDHVKQEKLIILEGRLTKEEEAALIQKTMESISKKFQGIELAVIDPDKKNTALFDKLKQSVIHMLLGNRLGMTVIGPASIVKEIKQDPNKIQLLVEQKTKKRR